MPVNAEDMVQSLGHKDPLEEEMATHSSILAWNIPWTEEPGRGQSPWGRKESDTLKQSGTHSCRLISFSKTQRYRNIVDRNKSSISKSILCFIEAPNVTEKAFFLF